GVSRASGTCRGRVVRPAAPPRHTEVAPVTPDAPDLFSTTMDCPMRSCISAASTRAGTSDSPPGANGTTKVTGRLGYVCVRADGAASTTARTVTKNNPSRGRRGSAYVVMYPSRGRAQLATAPQAHRVPH